MKPWTGPDPEFWREKRVGVTGGTGFIGKHLVAMLNPICRDLAVTGRGVPFENVDLLFGLAGHVGGIAYNRARHGTLFRDNMNIGLQTLEAARFFGIKRTVMVSSACVYPALCTIPTPEDEVFHMEPEATNRGYGWAKRMQEYAAMAYVEEFGLDVRIARPYNAYGPGDHFEVERSHVIPALIRKAFDPGEELVLWGSGEQSRSFLYVRDFVRGLICVAERGPVCRAVNIGADEEITMFMLASLILELSGNMAGKRIECDTTRPDGHARRLCDTTLANELMGFRATTSLAEGLKATIDYYKEIR